jgi:hypothetical protein
MAEEKGVTEKKEEKGDSGGSWRDQAKKEGYAFLPATELEEMKKGIGSLKSLRSKIPEPYRDKEDEFFTTALDAIKTVESGSGPDVEAVRTELTNTKRTLTNTEKKLTTLEAEREALKKENRNLTMWGHIEATRKSRNVYVSDKLISDADVNGFPLDDYKTDTQEGVKALSAAVWTKILEPAWKEQQNIARAGGGSAPPQDSRERTSTDEDTTEKRKLPKFGSLA